jgi:hypothetical protein
MEESMTMQSRLKKFKFVGGAIAMGLAFGTVPAFADHTGPLVSPTPHAGNFVPSDPGSDQQICFDIWALSGNSPVTGDIVGFKVDPPGPYSDGFVSFGVSSPDGRLLSWESEPGVSVLGVIVKGGPNFNLYDYQGADLDPYPNHDNGLLSPLNKAGKLPQISHYNVCYVKPVPPQEVQGCTRGYWGNHADRWAGVAPSDDFDATFGADLFSPNVTLGTAINLGGGGTNQLAAQGISALLNAYGGTPNPGNGATVQNYAYSADVVKAMVKGAVEDYQACLVVANSDGAITNAERNACLNAHVNPVASAFDAANNAGCPLSDTPAVKP